MHVLHSVTAPFLAEGTQSLSIDYAPKAFVNCETELLAVMKVLKLFVSISINVAYVFPKTQPPSLALL